MTVSDPAYAVAVPATTANLGPGFDAFGAALDLRLRVAVADGPGPRVTTLGEGAGEVPDDDGNLVWASLLAACGRFGWDVPDVRLEVHNPIPLARGLGSSSAAIVAGLALARALAGADAGIAAAPGCVGDLGLLTLADELEGHPDNVAPALLGGVVACARRSDGTLAVRTSPPAPTTRTLALVPDLHTSTERARQRLPASLPTPDVIEQAARAGHVLSGLLGVWPVDPSVSGDLLHEPARAGLARASADLTSALRADRVHAWLSGAGPSVVAALPVRDVDGLVDVVRRHAAAGGFAVRELAWDLQGARACPAGGCAIAGSGGCLGCPRRSVA